MRMGSTEAQNLLRRFYKLQEERVEAYRLFEDGHQAYLAAAPAYNFIMYRQLVHEITQTFKKISEEIIDISHTLREKHDLPGAAEFVTKVQEEEKNKLTLTAQLQIAKQKMIDHPNEDSYQEEVEDLKNRIIDVIERINEHLDELKYESEDILTV